MNKAINHLSYYPVSVLFLLLGPTTFMGDVVGAGEFSQSVSFDSAWSL